MNFLSYPFSLSLTSLKGVWHEIFNFRLFYESVSLVWIPYCENRVTLLMTAWLHPCLSLPRVCMTVVCLLGIRVLRSTLLFDIWLFFKFLLLFLSLLFCFLSFYLSPCGSRSIPASNPPPPFNPIEKKPVIHAVKLFLLKDNCFLP